MTPLFPEAFVTWSSVLIQSTAKSLVGQKFCSILPLWLANPNVELTFSSTVLFDNVSIKLLHKDNIQWSHKIRHWELSSGDLVFFLIIASGTASSSCLSENVTSSSSSITDWCSINNHDPHIVCETLALRCVHAPGTNTTFTEDCYLTLKDEFIFLLMATHVKDGVTL